ncbi:murein biosynthesis integral membrane protein MurJ [bacterium]|nr:murein biosynthesis integral membrane protein MurJ [bacterium]
MGSSVFRFLNTESKSLVGAAAIVGGLSFASRIVGLVRDRILLGEFGAGNVLDAYYAAFKLPDLLFSLLVIGSLSAGFIPIFTKHWHAIGEKEKAWKFTNNALNIIAAGMAAISLVVLAFAGPVAGLIAPGFDAVKRGMVEDFTRVMLLAEFILALSVVFGSVLQGMKRFLLFSLAPILYNVGIIVGALVFVKWFGPIGLAWGVVLGAGLHFFVQLYGVLSAGYRYRPVLNHTDKDVRELAALTGPRMLGIAVGQVDFMVLTILATTLAAGSVTIFQVAYNIQYFVAGIVGVSFAIAAFPTLSEAAEKKDNEHFINTFEHAVRQALFFSIPLMVVFLVLRAQIVRVVAGAGAFDWTATRLAADTLAFFTLSFVPQCLTFILARAFFALRDSMTPLTMGIVSTVLSLVSGLYFSHTLGVMGMAIAFTIGAFADVALLWVPLRQRLGTLHEYRILRALYVMAFAGLGCAVTTQVLKPIITRVISLDTFLGVLTQGLIAGGAGIGVYVLISYGLKSEDLAQAMAGIRRRVMRKANPVETIPVGE